MKDEFIEAIENYKKFLDIMKDTDPGIVEVEDARKKQAGLNLITTLHTKPFISVKGYHFRAMS